MDACESCAFAVAERIDSPDNVATYVLLCHRNPPTTNLLDGRAVFGWPKVRRHDWCGEHRVSAILPRLLELAE